MLVMVFSLYRTPFPQPHPDPTQHPKTRQKPPETDPIGLKGAETDRNGSNDWTFRKLSGVGDGGGFVGLGGGV